MNLPPLVVKWLLDTMLPFPDWSCTQTTKISLFIACLSSIYGTASCRKEGSSTSCVKRTRHSFYDLLSIAFAGARGDEGSMPDFRGFECRFSLEPIRIILADSYGDDRRGAGLYYRIYKECFMNKKIRFAVIGCGHIGKRHAR